MRERESEEKKGVCLFFCNSVSYEHLSASVRRFSLSLASFIACASLPHTSTVSEEKQRL